MSDPILDVRQLRAGYGDEDILHGVSITVTEGRIVAIIGPNGSGKSTLLKAIYGLIPIRAGAVSLAGKQLAGLRPHRITALGANLVPQLSNVFPDLSVSENLEVGATLNRHRLRERLDAVLAALPNLRALLTRRAATLSGGQRQILAVGRALMSDPRLLIL
ncbi:MAG TPA: ATP-binding cassette domain-containing protein, partial [Acetobacteraceae bacterium]